MEQLADRLNKFISKFECIDYKEVVNEHLKYGTIDALENDGRIIAVVRYNITPSGATADILDLWIDHKDGLNIIKYFIKNGLNKYPKLKYIRFIREKKYNNRNTRIYRIKDLIKEKSYGR